MNKTKVAFGLNLVVFILEVFAVGWMVLGFSGAGLPLTQAGIGSLRYFTVDSNILLGISALIMAVEQLNVVKGKKSAVPVYAVVFKHASTVSVALTMLVTAFFLAPMAGKNWMSLFMRSNFFMHLFNPLLAITVWLCFEKKADFSFRHTFSGIVPMVLYAVFYLQQTFTHVTDGVIDKGYDWYGFFFMGLNSGFIVLPLVFAVTYLISLVLWKLNRLK